MTFNRETILWFLIGGLWVFVGSYPLVLRAMYCPQQPLHQPCTITIRQ